MVALTRLRPNGSFDMTDVRAEGLDTNLAEQWAEQEEGGLLVKDGYAWRRRTEQDAIAEQTEALDHDNQGNASWSGRYSYNDLEAGLKLTTEHDDVIATFQALTQVDDLG